MSHRRYFVLADGTPVTWDEHVIDGVPSQPILVALVDGDRPPWVVLWAPADVPLEPGAEQWARAHTTPGPVPPLRRPAPDYTRPSERSLRVIRGGRQ